MEKNPPPRQAQLFATTLSRTERWLQEKVVPDLISHAPEEMMTVFYDDLEVQFGNEFTSEQVKHEPKVQWATETGTFYTLGMVDLDPGNITLREILHWLIVNIPGTSDNTKERPVLTQGEVIAGYRGSSPPQGSGFHRYVFLAYKQPGKLKFDEVHIPAREGRLKFKIDEKFAKKYNLIGPIAGNFYKCQFRDTN